MPAWFAVLAFALAMGCASVDRQAHQEYHKHLQQGHWRIALERARSERFYADEHSRLVKWLEQAMLHHLQGEYYQAQQLLDRAMALTRSLFTVSLSRKALQAVGSDSLDHYYGEVYEHSLLRFYSSLNHYLLYQQGFYEAHSLEGRPQERRGLAPQERGRHLAAARAVVVEWNARIQQWRGERAGQTVFKDDLLAKVFGAFVHQRVGGRSELQIARLLYRDAHRVILQNYNVYPSFNLLGEKFKRNYQKLPELSREQVRKEYVLPTPRAQALEQYLVQRERAARPSNVTVVIHHGLIAAKQPKKYFFPLDLASRIKTIVTGEMTPSDFAIQVLGIVSQGGIPAIEFELPEIKPPAVTASFSVQIARGDQVLATHPLHLVSPLSEIAQEAVRARALATRLRLGARLAGKHIAAIVSAYAAYQTAVNGGTPEFAAQLLATGLYLAAAKKIASSERADLRSWMSLPHTLNMTAFYLEPGTYQLSLRKDEAGEITTYPLPPLTLAPEATRLVSTRVL